MATIYPSRTFYQLPMEYALSWEIGVRMYEDDEGLVVASDAEEIPGETSRFAMQFKTDEASWVSDGTITESNCMIFCCMEEFVPDEESPAVRVAPITETWNAESSRAHMEGLSVGDWVWGYFIPERINGWVSLSILDDSSILRNQYGIMVKSSSSDLSAQIKRTPQPVGRAYFQFSISDTELGSATTRLTLSADAISKLGHATSSYEIVTTIRKSLLIPSESDLEIPATKEGYTILNRSVSFPESWAIDYGTRGNISLSNNTELTSRGHLMELVLKQKYANTSAVTIARAWAVIGGIERTRERQDLTLEDAGQLALERGMFYRDRLRGMEGVNIDDETSTSVIANMIVNGGGILWQNFRYNDFVYLMQRFGSTWEKITYTTEELLELTISELCAVLASRHGLCISRGVDDSIQVWHPACYRPSLKIWELNQDQMKDDKFIRERPKDRYNKIEVETIGGDTGQSYSAGELPLGQDEIDRVYSLGDLKGLTNEIARDGLATQLAQRFTGERYKLECTVGMIAIGWECGDQVKITAPCYGLDETLFLLVSVDGSPLTGQYSLTLLHHPDNIGLHSTFTDTNVIGIWRWWDWVDEEWTGVDQSWLATGGTWTKNSGIPEIYKIDWRGAVFQYGAITNAVEAPETFAPTNTANNCDLVDFVLGVYGEQQNDPECFADPLYNIIFRFGKSGTDEAVVLAIKRPEQEYIHDPNRHSPVACRIILGHTEDYTANTIVWTNIIETAPGVGVTSDYYGADKTWRLFGIGIQWKDSEIRLYVNQRFIGSFSVSKSGFNEAYITTPQNIQYKENAVGCLRWLKRTDGEWFETNRLFGKNGIDEYYP